MSPAQYVSVSLATCVGLCRFGEAWAALRAENLLTYLLPRRFISLLALRFSAASFLSGFYHGFCSSLLGFVSPWVRLSLGLSLLACACLVPSAAAALYSSDPYMQPRCRPSFPSSSWRQRLSARLCYSIMILAPSGSFKHTCSRNTCGSMAIIDSHGSVHAGQHGLATLVGMEGSS